MIVRCFEYINKLNSNPYIWQNIVNLVISCLSFQDSQNDTFLRLAGVYLLVPKD